MVSSEQIDKLRDEIVEYEKVTDKWLRCLIGCALYIIMVGAIGEYVIDYIHIKLVALMVIIRIIMPFMVLFYGIIVGIRTYKSHKRTYELLDLIDKRRDQLYEQALNDKDPADPVIDANNLNKYFI